VFFHDHEAFGPNVHIFQHTTRKQLKTAMKRVGEHTRNRYSARKLRHITDVVLFLMDYPVRHSGNVVGLATKSIRWHRQQRLDRFKRSMKDYNLQDEVAKPTIELPDDPRIKFLATVQDILNEAQDMNHCINGYVKYAMRGDCYLFHVEYKGEHASIEVDPFGQVRQSHGPYNKDNEASKWGRRRLGRWAKEILGERPRPTTNPCAEIPIPANFVEELAQL